MDTFSGLARGAANRKKELMVFDWDKAARLIAERNPKVAGAGLQSDWKWTGGEIWRDGKPTPQGGHYLSSTWATPELDLDGEIVECYRMESEVPDWGPNTYWPESALKIVSATN